MKGCLNDTNFRVQLFFGRFALFDRLGACSQAALYKKKRVLTKYFLHNAVSLYEPKRSSWEMFSSGRLSRGDGPYDLDVIRI